LQIELHDISEEEFNKTQNAPDNEELMLLNNQEISRLEVKKKKPRKSKLSPENENQEIISLLKSFHKKLDSYIDTQRKNIVYNLPLHRDKRSDKKPSVLKKLNSLTTRKSFREEEDMQKSSIVRKLKTLNFDFKGVSVPDDFV